MLTGNPSRGGTGETVPNLIDRPLILVIDDDPNILQVYVGALELEGWRVLCAANAFDGLNLASIERPDLVVLDLHLPRVNGDWFAETLRLRGITTPIALISADAHAAHYATQIGADVLLPKPFELDEFVSLVRSFVVPAA